MVFWATRYLGWFVVGDPNYALPYAIDVDGFGRERGGNIVYEHTSHSSNINETLKQYATWRLLLLSQFDTGNSFKTLLI